MNFQLALTLRPVVERAWTAGLFKQRAMSPQEVAFVRMKLIAQGNAEKAEQAQKRDPEAWAKRLEKARRYNRAYRERMKANAARV